MAHSRTQPVGYLQSSRGEPDASARPHNRLPDDPVSALKGDIGFYAVAIIRPAIAQNESTSLMDHDLADDPARAKLLPSQIQRLADERQVNVSGRRHRRVPRSDMPRRKVGHGAPQPIPRRADTFAGSPAISYRAEERLLLEPAQPRVCAKLGRSSAAMSMGAHPSDAEVWLRSARRRERPFGVSTAAIWCRS